MFSAPGPLHVPLAGLRRAHLCKKEGVEVKLLHVQPTPAVLAVMIPCPWSQRLSPQVPPFPSLLLLSPPVRCPAGLALPPCVCGQVPGEDCQSP